MIQKQVSASPSLPPSFKADVERALFSLNHAFDPLHKDCALDFHVSGVRNGYVYLSFALPEGMTRAFVGLLQSLHGFFRFADLKSRLAAIEEKTVDPVEIQKGREIHEGFRSEVCRIFDGFTDQGVEMKEAVKRTNSALKAEGSPWTPWATYSITSDVLRASGRLRKRR